MTENMTGKVEFVFNDPKVVCDVCEKNLDLRLVRFIGQFLVCKRCLLATATLLTMNEGIG